MGHKAFLSLALLFLASVISSKAQSTEPAAAEAARDGGGVNVAEDDGAIAVVFEVRGNLSLDCRPLVADAGVAREWLINATALEALPAAARARWTLSAAGTVLSAAGRASEDDFGNFTCRAGGAERRWRVRARRHAKLAANTNVVEGQKLKLTCKLLGKPYAPVQWAFSNVSFEKCNESLVSGNASSDSLDARVALGVDRVTLRPSEQGVEDAELVLEPAARADAGWLCCAPAERAEGAADWPEAWRARAAVTTLRVKDMYAALWPFLGICAEVLVLCAVILVYERRRTKPELDDSDTDNHDQKKS